MTTKIDLFNLIDKNITKPGSWIMAKGEKLNLILRPLIEKSAIKFGSKRKLTLYLMNKYNLSQSTSERFVWLMKEWPPLFLLKEISELNNLAHLEFQENINYLKKNWPPQKVFMAVKELNEELCKIAGAHAADGTLTKNFLRITDGYKISLIKFNNWIEKIFGVKYIIKKVKNSNEWGISFHSGIIVSYMNKILEFPLGSKVYTVSEPKIIKNSELNLKKAFALGALTFEGGISIRNQVELCVASKGFRDSISEILNCLNINHVKMENKSQDYWRLWSGNLSKEKAEKWSGLFEEETEKWYLLKNIVDGYRGKANSFEEALEILDRVYPPKSASKVCIRDILLAIKEFNKSTRYELVDYLCKKKNINSFGGRWAHSLSPYISVLKNTNIIYTSKEKFGKKKSFGSIIREVYTYNPNFSEWKMPLTAIKSN